MSMNKKAFKDVFVLSESPHDTPQPCIIISGLLKMNKAQKQNLLKVLISEVDNAYERK